MEGELPKNYVEVFEAEMLKYQGFLFGDLIVTQEYLLFSSFGYATPSDDLSSSPNSPDTFYKTARHQSNTLDNLMVKKMLIIRWCEIEELLQRPCYGPKNGVELITCEKKHYSFNLLKLENTKKFFNLAEKLKKDNELGIEIITNPV